MEVVIIEDEKPAAEKLLKMLGQTDNSVQVKKILNSVEESVVWLNANPSPDLVFMDIELTDGLSFTLFELTQIACPVIFVTAFDDYWQKAFEHSGIDYLLKPIKAEKLSGSLKKYEKIKKHFSTSLIELSHYFKNESQLPKKRILVKKGTELFALKSAEIAYCYAFGKMICVVTMENQKFILDRSLADIENELGTSDFFRINRKYLANINAIKKIRIYGKGKLLITLNPPVSEEVIMANQTAAVFKTWISR